MQERQKKALTSKERQFCYWYAQTGNGLEAAWKAGYRALPERAALKLTQRSEIREEINCCAKQAGFRKEAAAGLRRLAFGSVNDALRLLFTEDGAGIDGMDLYNVSEIKRPKTGGVEIKFFDRQKALEKLAELADGEEEAGTAFYQALERSGKLAAIALQEEPNGR